MVSHDALNGKKVSRTSTKKKGIAGFAHKAKKYIGEPKNKFAITCKNSHTRNEIQKSVIIGVRKR
jgi:hypothetical protein